MANLKNQLIMIGLVDVDYTGYPNLALMKIAQYHIDLGEKVEFANPLFNHYDVVYKSKIFNFTDDDLTPYNCPVIKGGTGYDIYSKLPDNMEFVKPYYKLYNIADNKAYGFLTRGCPNKCAWCIVPKKEGGVKPYMDIEEIAIDGRNEITLMDNNILASDYGLQQIKKIIDLGLKVDFNQGLDARLVTKDIAEMLSKVKWLRYIRFGCDTPKQIEECERAMNLIDSFGKKKQYLLYTIINSDIQESYERLSYFRGFSNVRIFGQPFRDTMRKNVIPQWQKDMARWANVRRLWTKADFKEVEFRKQFRGINHFYIKDI